MDLSYAQFKWINDMAKGLFIICDQFDIDLPFSSYILWVQSAVSQVKYFCQKFHIGNVFNLGGNVEMKDYQLIRTVLDVLCKTLDCIEDVVEDRSCCHPWFIQNQMIYFPCQCTTLTDKKSLYWKKTRLGLSPEFEIDDFIKEQAIRSADKFHIILNVSIENNPDIDCVIDKLYNIMFPAIYIQTDRYSSGKGLKDWRSIKETCEFSLKDLNLFSIDLEDADELTNAFQYYLSKRDVSVIKDQCIGEPGEVDLGTPSCPF